jgi:nucleoside-diphosphate-sugar epimerase
VKQVFLTGANGFIGRTLAQRLRGLGVRVVGVDLHADADGDVLAGDITRDGAWQQRVRGSDVLVHTAALVSNAASPADAWTLNVLGTRRVLEAARDAGVDRVVHLSSIRAFSDLDFPDGVEESYPVRTDGNSYVDTKVASEQVALQAHACGEVPVTVIRPGDVYGPGSRPWTVLPVEAIRARRFVLPAHGRGIFSPIFVDNLVDGLLSAAEHPAAAGEVLTLTDGKAVTCAEFFGHYYRMLGRRGPVCTSTRTALALATVAATTARLSGRATESNPATVRYLTRTGTYSTDKARRLLAFEPKVDLTRGMELTQRWLEDAGLI